MISICLPLCGILRRPLVLRPPLWRMICCWMRWMPWWMIMLHAQRLLLLLLLVMAVSFMALLPLLLLLLVRQQQHPLHLPSAHHPRFAPFHLPCRWMRMIRCPVPLLVPWVSRLLLAQCRVAAAVAVVAAVAAVVVVVAVIISVASLLVLLVALPFIFPQRLPLVVVVVVVVVVPAVPLLRPHPLITSGWLILPWICSCIMDHWHRRCACWILSRARRCMWMNG